MLIIVVQGTNIGAVYPISKTDVTVIGRGEECDIRVLDLMVSRRHCQIEWKANKYYIKDLNSTNKTLLNKKVIEGLQMLEPGDTIRIGDTVLLFNDTEEIPIKSVKDYQILRMSKTKKLGV